MIRVVNKNDLSTYGQSTDQIQLEGPFESIPVLFVNSNTNEYVVNLSSSIPNMEPDRHVDYLQSSTKITRILTLA